MSLYSSFAKLCYFCWYIWRCFVPTKIATHTHTHSSPTQRQILAETLFELTMIYDSFHSNVAKEKGEMLRPPLHLQMESQTAPPSHHLPSSYVQIMVHSFPFLKTKWIINLQHYWVLSYLHWFLDLRNWLFFCFLLLLLFQWWQQKKKVSINCLIYKTCNICTVGESFIERSLVN